MIDKIIDAMCWLIGFGLLAAGVILVLGLEPCTQMLAVGCR